MHNRNPCSTEDLKEKGSLTKTRTYGESTDLECNSERGRAPSERRRIPGIHHRSPQGKVIEMVQICLKCERRFAFKRGRKRCPCCQGLLRPKAVVLNVR